MPLVVNPLRIPAFYDKLNIGGVDNPGVCKLEGGARKYSWESKEPSGGQGGFLTYRGWGLSDGIKAKFLFWEAEQIDAFYSDYYPLLQYDATKREPKPVAVFHPALAANNIRTLVVNEIGPLVDEGVQLWSVTVEFTEYAPAPKKNATATPKAAIVMSDPHGDPVPNATAEDRQQAEIKKLLAESDLALPDSGDDPL